jgi:hypothetical protein
MLRAVKYVAVSFLGLASVAQADVIVEQGSYNGLLNRSFTAQPPGFLMPQFDSALGALQSASLEIEGRWYGEDTVFFGNSFATDVPPANPALLTSSLSIELAGEPATPVLYKDTSSQFVTLSMISPIFGAPSLGWVGDGPLTSLSSLTVQLDLATFGSLLISGLPYVLGNDEIFVNVDGESYISFNGVPYFGGPFSPIDGTAGSFTASLTYTYDPVPEPSTAALLILPIMMLARRRRGSSRHPRS